MYLLPGESSSCSVLFYIPFSGHLVLKKISVLGTYCSGCEHRKCIMHLKGLFSDVFTTRRPFLKMFGLRGKISRKLISIHMPPHGVALNCQDCLSVSLYCHRLMCAGEEEPPKLSINDLRSLQ